MKIVAPLNSLSELNPLIQAGADEIYFGYLDKRWTAKYEAFTGNRRENYTANITEENELTEIVYLLNCMCIQFAVTMNDRYSQGQYSSVRYVLDNLAKVGVKNLIIADTGLMLALNEWGYKFDIHASTGSGCFNHKSVDFYKSFNGVSRVILPRQLTINEINAISCNVSGIEIEVFGMYGKDPFIDAFCRFHHGIHMFVNGLGPCGCMRLNESELIGADCRKEKKPYECLNTLYVDGCSACALPKLDGSRVSHVKVVGRSAKIERKIEAIAMMKHAIEVSGTELSYQEKTAQNRKRFFLIYHKECEKNNCYFAE